VALDPPGAAKIAPPRGAAESAEVGTAESAAMGGRALVARRPSPCWARKGSFLGIVAGRCVGVHDGGTDSSSGLPSFLVRSFHLSLLHASLSFGALVLVGGLIGILVRRRAHRPIRGKKQPLQCTPSFPRSQFVGNRALLSRRPGVLSTTLVDQFSPCCSYPRRSAWSGWVRCWPPSSHLVPGTMRATASALFLFINNLIGIGLGHRAPSAWCSGT